MSLINNTLFETVYTDPSGQDWKVLLHSKQAMNTGIRVGSGVAFITTNGWAVTGPGVTSTSRVRRPDPGTTQLAASYCVQELL